MHTTWPSQLAWVKDIGSDEPSNHHEQSRSLDLRSPAPAGQASRRMNSEDAALAEKDELTMRARLFGEGERLIDDLLDRFGAC